MSKFWYLLRYHYGMADRAIVNLRALGVNCFSPCKKLNHKPYRKQGAVKKQLEHIFPPYLFIEFEPEVIPFISIKYTAGVSGFVRFG
jgi:transcriptional antiterminator RfaH